MHFHTLDALALVLFFTLLSLLLALDPYARETVPSLSLLPQYCCERAVTASGVVLSSQYRNTNLFFTLSDGTAVWAVRFNATPDERALVQKGAHVRVNAIVQDDGGAPTLLVRSVQPA